MPWRSLGMTAKRRVAARRTSPRGEEELLAARVAGTSKRPVVTERGRHVVEPVVDHDDTLNHRCEPDGADLIDIVRPDTEQLLGELHLLVWSYGAGGVDDLHDPLDRRRRFHSPLFATCVTSNGREGM